MCGIAGAFHIPDASNTVALMLRTMQHRGPQATGIASVDDNGELFVEKGRGSVDKVFRKREEFPRRLPGASAVGHLHYSTSGAARSPDNIHPFTMMHGDRQFAFVFNGNITNQWPLTQELEATGAAFRTGNDTELFPQLVAVERARDAQASLWELLARASNRLEGAYSTLLLAPDRLLAIRDPYGFRPLVVGRYKGGVVFASESCALDLIGATEQLEVPPGMICEVTSENKIGLHPFAKSTFTRQCSFEHIYFSRPDSRVFGSTSAMIRNRLGKILGEKLPIDQTFVDVVTSVPDSSNAMAIACAEALGVPFRCALIRNHTVGRTFLAPDQLARELGVKLKFGVVIDEVKGKRVLLVDDSIVRATTMSNVVQLLLSAGAREVHVAIASPPVVHPCYWGIDTPTREELIAAKKPIREIKTVIGATSVIYLNVVELREALHDKEGNKFCTTCFTGEAPIPNQIVPVSRLRTTAG